MDYDQESKLDAETEQDKAILVFRMLRIRDNTSVFVKKRRLCLLEGDSVLLEIVPCLSLIPLEPEVAHPYSVTTL